jgi:hypothetical protein
MFGSSVMVQRIHRTPAGYLADINESAPEPADAERDLERAITWLKVLPKSFPTEHPGVGLGTNVVLSSPKAGASGLVVDGALVHLGAFAIEGGGPRFARPSRRARQHE